MENNDADSPGEGNKVSGPAADSFLGEDFYRMLLMNANVWITFIDEKTRVDTWNHAAEEISGYKAEEVAGSSEIWGKLYPDPEYRKKVSKKIAEIISNTSSLEKFESVIRRKDGSSRVISWNTKEIREKSGNIKGYFIVGIDITDIIQLQTNFQSLLMNANVLISFLDSKGRIRVWNRFAEEITGYKSDEVTTGSAVWEFLYPDPDYRKFTEDKIEGILADRHSIEMFETEIRTKSGSRKNILWNTRAVYYNEDILEGYIIIGLDITHEKEMQSEIYRYIGSAVVRLKYPVEIIMNNLHELYEKVSADDISREDALLHIQIQIKNAEQILKNLYDLNQAVQDSFKEMPENMKDFLKEQGE